MLAVLAAVSLSAPTERGEKARVLGTGDVTAECRALFGGTYYVNGMAVSVWDISAATEDVTPCNEAAHPEGTPCGWGVYSYWDSNSDGEYFLSSGEAQGYCSYGVSSECGDMGATQIPAAYLGLIGEPSEEIEVISAELIALGHATNCYIADACTANHCTAEERKAMARLEIPPSPPPASASQPPPSPPPNRRRPAATIAASIAAAIATIGR